MAAPPPLSTDLVRPFLHLPEGSQYYVCIVDEQRRAFDFSDNTFKPGSALAHCRDASLPATGRHEPRADHAYSYTVEIDLPRLLNGTTPESIPSEGATVTIHWLRQIGDEPDVSIDTQLPSTFSFRNVAGRFHLVNQWDADRVDESRAFAKREAFEKEYREFVLRELNTRVARGERLGAAVRDGDVGGVLRILAEDICNWAGNLKRHFLHQVSHLAKDPFFVRSIDVPEDAPFYFFADWIVREWIGSQEAFDLLEFHKSAEYAQSFSGRLDPLHESRVTFATILTEYTVRTRGEDVEGMISLDEIRKDLKHQAIWLAAHLDRIATQFDSARPSPLGQSPTPHSGSPVQPQLDHSLVADPQPFSGGEMVFHADRVELCGVDICSGPRSGSRRIVLELLSRRTEGGVFAFYSGENLDEEAKRHGAKGTAAGWIRDLRDDIYEALRTQANIISERKDVILSGGPGYRFAESLSVHHAEQPVITDILDIDESDDVPNVPDDDVRDAFGVPDDEGANRRTWILDQLTEGVRLKAPEVVKQFGCSRKTAYRSLLALQKEELIEYVGSTRTGHYRLREPPEAPD